MHDFGFGICKWLSRTKEKENDKRAEMLVLVFSSVADYICDLVYSYLYSNEAF
jgi:hypothetical protein